MKVVRYGDHPATSVYVGRPSIFGNPFRIGPDGDRAEVIAKYREYFNSRLASDPDFWFAVVGLKDANLDLGCHCAPAPCHADVILEWLTQYRHRLWVDDLRPPPDLTWTWVKTSADAIRALASPHIKWVELSLDHDLGGDDTTRSVVLFLAENGGWPLHVRVHSMNPVGAEWLRAMVERYQDV